MSNTSQKTCIITGANSGIGKAAAIQVASQGHRVVMACRNPERGVEALREVQQRSGSTDVELMTVDMSMQSSIRSFAECFMSEHSTLDILVHNAAAFDIRQKERVETSEGIELVWATNHIGPVLLTDCLMPALRKSAQGRIVTVASKGLVVYPFLKVDVDDPEFSKRPFSVQKAYYQSKLAQVMYTYWLAGQLRDTGITVNAIRVTNVKIDVDSRYPGVPAWMRKLYSLKSRFSITPEEMAETYTHLALSPELSKTSGAYFDSPTRRVTSNSWSRSEGNISRVMNSTLSYLKNST